MGRTLGFRRGGCCRSGKGWDVGTCRMGEGGEEWGKLNRGSRNGDLGRGGGGEGGVREVFGNHSGCNFWMILTRV